MVGNRLFQHSGNVWIRRNGRGKNKEAQKSHQQHVIDLFQKRSVRECDGCQHDCQRDRPELCARYDDQNDQNEQRNIDSAPPLAFRRPWLFARAAGNFLARILSEQKEYEPDQQNRGQRGQRQHMQHETPDGNIDLTV